MQGWDSQDGCKGSPNFPSPPFLWLQRHVVPHVPVLGFLASRMPGRRNFLSLGKDEGKRVDLWCVLIQAPSTNKS